MRWFWISDSPVWDLEIPKPIISQSQSVSGDIFICRTKYRTFAQHDFQNTWASAVLWFYPGKHSLNRGSHSIFGSRHLVCLHIWFLFVIYLISVSYIFDFLLVIYIWFLFAYLVFLWSCARPGVCLAGWHPETLTHAPGQRSLHIIYIIIIVIIIIKTTTIIIINNNTISAIILIGFVLSFLTFFSPASSSTAQN